MAKYFILKDQDKSAFTSKLNSFLKQINTSLGVGSESFKDVPSIGDKEDLTLFIAVNKWEELAMDALLKNDAFDFSVKEVSEDKLKTIIQQIQ